MDKNKLRTRFAPSPTGSLHIGGLRTALFSYALAKHDQGDFVLRIEDTDKKREMPGATEEIQQILADFDLKWDELYIQSERVKKGVYKKAAQKLVSQGHAFYCQCQAKNAKEKYSTELRDPCRDKNLGDGAIKLKVPEGEKVTYRDFVIGKEISWDTNDVADATLLKSDGFPTYHLAVVVDDHQMHITHALRGYDWLPSTPIHLLVYRFLGYDMPHIGHLTDILDPDGGKLSKRKGSVSVKSFLEEGYLREALLNFVMLLGWAPKNDQEIFSLGEFVEVFNEEGLQRSNPIFNRDKLLWMNSQYIQNSPNEKLQNLIYKFYDGKYDKDLLSKIIPLVKTRIKRLSEFDEISQFLVKNPNVNKELLGKDYDQHLHAAEKALEGIDNWNLENINKGLMAEIEKKGFKTGKFFMDLRIALSGKKITPPINESMEILGKEQTLARINKLL